MHRLRVSVAVRQRVWTVSYMRMRVLVDMYAYAYMCMYVHMCIFLR